jgi:hypothetical protein
MSSETMRNETESFINSALSEGWGGWPRREDARLAGIPHDYEELFKHYDWTLGDQDTVSLTQARFGLGNILFVPLV